MEFPIVPSFAIAMTAAGEVTGSTGGGFAELIDAFLDTGAAGNDDIARDEHMEGEEGDELDTNTAPTPIAIPPVANSMPAPITTLPPTAAEAPRSLDTGMRSRNAMTVPDPAPLGSPVVAGGMAEEADDVTSDVATVFPRSEQHAPVRGSEQAPVSAGSPVSRPAVDSLLIVAVAETREPALIVPIGQAHVELIGQAPVEPSVPAPAEEIRPGPRPVEPAPMEVVGDIALSPVQIDDDNGQASVVEGPGMSVVIDRIEEWLEQTGGVEPTTISLELPDPDGDLLVRVALRDGQLELSVIRADGEAPAWFIDRLEEALTGHGFEMAGHRHRQSGSDEAPDQPAPAPSPRRRPRRTDGLWM